MIWAIYVLYEQVVEYVLCPSNLSNCFTSIVGVKQCCPLSQDSLFGIYINEVTNFIAYMGGNGVDLGGTQVNIFLSCSLTDDIVLLSKVEHALQRHHNVLYEFCTQRGLVANLGKTKVLIIHTHAHARNNVT